MVGVAELMERLLGREAIGGGVFSRGISCCVGDSSSRTSTLVERRSGKRRGRGAGLVSSREGVLSLFWGRGLLRGRVVDDPGVVRAGLFNQ